MDQGEGLADLSRRSASVASVGKQPLVHKLLGEESYSGRFLHITIGICTWTRKEDFAISEPSSGLALPFPSLEGL